jgi:hypothetical protein
MRIKLGGFEVEAGLWALYVRVPMIGEAFFGSSGTTFCAPRGGAVRRAAQQAD